MAATSHCYMLSIIRLVLNELRLAVARFHLLTSALVTCLSSPQQNTWLHESKVLTTSQALNILRQRGYTIKMACLLYNLIFR